MKQLYPLRKVLAATLLLAAASSCVDSAYDLNNVSLKMTLGPNGVTIPLGRVDSLTVDSLIRSSDIKDMVVEDGFLAYKLDSIINEKIDAITIEPIRDVIPSIEPYIFSLSDAKLPTSFDVAGFTNSTNVELPSLDFTEQSFPGINTSRSISLSTLIGSAVPDGQPFPALVVAEDEDFNMNISSIPTEVAAIKRIYFGGSAKGTPVRVKFTLGALATAVKGGKITFEVAMPQSYTIGDGISQNNSNTFTFTKNVTGSEVEFQLYIKERVVTESITAQQLNLEDFIKYTFSYLGTSNGASVPSGSDPILTIEVAPQVADADIVSAQITPLPTTSTTNIAVEMKDLGSISEVNYVAFATSFNTINLSATHTAIPLRGDVKVNITFPSIFDLGSFAGLSNNVLATTMDRLVTGINVPIKGIKLSGNEAKVTNGELSISRPIVVNVAPSFPSGNYKLSELGEGGDVNISTKVEDLQFRIDTSNSVIKAGFSESVDIKQVIDRNFEVPEEVGGIALAQVINADTWGDAIFQLSLDIKNSPIEKCTFDDIVVALPKFIVAEHPKLDPATNSIKIGSVTYSGGKVVIANIVIKAIKDVAVTKSDKISTAWFKGDIRITSTVNVPENSVINGLDKTKITLLPSVVVSPLTVTEVKGDMNIDMSKYLKPTVIDLKDMREALGSQNVEINLVAPQISLSVLNPVGVTMVGDIKLQAYDFENKMLDPITIPNITLEPAVGSVAKMTKLFVTDGATAPIGYTLCHVADLSKLLKIVPSKLEVTYNLAIDKAREQSFVITGSDYPINVDYSIKIPLKFTPGGKISYTNTTNTADSFNSIDEYEITSEDVLLTIDASTTIPIDLGVTLEMLDAEANIVKGIKTSVLNKIAGYNAQTDGKSKESTVAVRLEFEGGNVGLLKQVAAIRYKINGDAVGAEAGLKPEQYIVADMKVTLKRGITIDLGTL